MNDPDNDPYQPPRAPLGIDREHPDGSDVPIGSPWATIWTDPRRTIRMIVESDPTYAVYPLGMLGGFASVLAALSQKVPGSAYSPGVLVLFALAAGSVLGVVGLYLQGLLIWSIGRGFGGVARAVEVRAALAWSAVPNVAALPVMLLLISGSGPSYFLPGGFEHVEPGNAPLVFFCGVAMMVLGLLGAVLTVRCVSEVHRFSAWLGLAVLVLTGLILFATLMAILFVVVVVMVATKQIG